MNSVSIRSLVEAMASSVGLLVLFFFLPLERRTWPIGVALGVLAIVAVIPLTRRNVRAIRTSDQPFLRALEAIALLATTLVVGFGAVYTGISQHSQQIPAMHTRIDALYFTITTLATVGFGDIVPVGQAARVIVAIQIAMDLILLGISVRLVGRAAQLRHEEKET